MSSSAASSVTVDVNVPVCKCNLPAQQRMVSKEGSQYRGRLVWLCSRGTRQQGGCGFFQANDDPQPSASAQKVVHNTHLVPTPPPQSRGDVATSASPHASSISDVEDGTHSASRGRKRSADDAGLDIAPVADSPTKRAATTSVVETNHTTGVEQTSFGALGAVVIMDTPAPPPSLSVLPQQQASSQQQQAPSSSTPALQVMCRCNIPANLLKSRKQNENFGRSFYSCSKPMNQRCNFFKWESDAINEAASDKFPAQERHVVRHDALAKQTCADDPIGNVMGRDVRALQEFIELAKQRRFTCIMGSPFDVMYAHRELRLVKGPYNQEDFWLVVRPMSQSSAPGPNGVWLHVHGVRPDDEGWVIAGQAHFIAFETPTEYLICSRRALWAYLDKKVLREMVSSPEQADHKCYKEGPLNEVITWVSLDALASWKDESVGVRSVILDRWPRRNMTSETATTMKNAEVLPPPTTTSASASVVPVPEVTPAVVPELPVAPSATDGKGDLEPSSSST